MPTNPIPFQKTQKIAFGFLLSVFIAGLLAYIVDSLDTSVKSAVELRTLLKIPVLGSVDQISTINEVRAKSLRNKAIVISWIVAALLARVVIALT
jgi:hypothetical protein